MTLEQHDSDIVIDTIGGSSYFNAEYYCNQIANCAVSADEAVSHYATVGWRYGLDPGPNFSTGKYLDRYPDVGVAELNPLYHFLAYGQPERRLADRPYHRRLPVFLPIPTTPSHENFVEVLARFETSRATDEEPVDVIVPVYKGAAETLRCIYSVLTARCEAAINLLVVNDCSPDTAITDRLKWLSDRGLIELLHTSTNSGFVAACNLGMLRHRNRDIVLLNSDTEVFDGWIDRLKNAAYRNSKTATVTPFSNNAEICSYPFFKERKLFALELSDAALDRLFASENAGKEFEIPTGVGFCMYVRRDAIDEIGILDAHNFGFGYGEENDFSRRVVARGRRNILAADVFVRHYGGVSFGDSKAARVKSAVEMVERLHPGYLDEVHKFISEDPLSSLRSSIDFARLKSAIEHYSRRAMLLVCHNRGGGTEKHLRQVCEKLEASHVFPLIARPHPKNGWKIVFSSESVGHLPNLIQLDLAHNPGHLAFLLYRLQVFHAHIHHLSGWIDFASDYFHHAFLMSGTPYDVTIHDHMSFCPRITMTDDEGTYCGEPGIDACETCIATHGSDFGHPLVWEWRERYARLLNGARIVFSPSQDAADRSRRYYGDLPYRVRPHWIDPSEAVPKARSPIVMSDRREVQSIAIAGAIGPHKGSRILLQCAQFVDLHDIPIRFILVGYSDRDNELSSCKCVTVTGNYADDDLPGLLLSTGASVVWFPGVWPETFSYTLSASLLAGLYPIAFDVGAIAERVRDAGVGRLLAPTLIDEVDVLVSTLHDTARQMAYLPSSAYKELPYSDFISDYYNISLRSAHAT